MQLLRVFHSYFAFRGDTIRRAAIRRKLCAQIFSRVVANMRKPFIARV